MLGSAARRAFSAATTAARPLTGRTAVITGSASGIGLGVARVLASRGADVVLHGIATPEELESLRSDIATAHGVKVATSDANLLRGREAAEALRSVAENELGRGVDILVNNAGIQHVSPIESFDEATFDRVIAINLTACFHTTKAVLPHMRKEGYGRIINIASAHGLMASANKSAYVAAKHGVMGLTKTTALETANSGITCNAICPGWVLTPLVEKQIADRAEKNGTTVQVEIRALLAEKQPQLEFVTPEQLGEFAFFLTGDHARNITGATMAADGGWTAH